MAHLQKLQPIFAVQRYHFAQVVLDRHQEGPDDVRPRLGALAKAKRAAGIRCLRASCRYDSLRVMSVEDLESAISRLSAKDLARFSAWFEQFMEDRWDRQIEEDIKTGRLDAAGKRADEDFETGRCTPL